MSDYKNLLPPGKEKFKEFVFHATEFLKEETADEAVWVVQEICKNLGISNKVAGTEKFSESIAEIKSRRTTPKLCECHCHDTKPDRVLVPSTVNERMNSFHSRLDHETHPMHTDLILENIFKYCSVKTLKSCRLVCNKWFALSLKSWRQNAVLGTDEIIEQNLVEELIKDGSEFRENPFKSYDVMDYGETKPDFEMTNNILDTFRLSIQYLSIYCTDFNLVMPLILSKLSELRHVKLQFFYDNYLRQCRSTGAGCSPFQNIEPSSKITKLQLNYGIAQLDSYDVEGGLPWEKVFEYVPALTYLQVKYDLDSSYSGSKRTHLKCLTQILLALHYARKKKDFTTLNLDQLDIMFHANHSTISISFPKKISDAICDCNLPLQRLHIDFGTYIHKWSVANILAKHGKTLKYLSAISGPNKSYLKKKLSLDLKTGIKVQLKNLKELQLFNGCVWAFHFLHSLSAPELESLRIEEMHLKEHRRHVKFNWKSVDTNFRKEHMKNLLDSLHFPNLKRFYYCGPRHLSPSELQLLAKSMPNVTNLGIPLSAKTFPVVCELWPGLKSLRVGQIFNGAYPLIDDYAITGLPYESSNYSNSARNKNITNLKELWSFELEGNVGQSYSRRPMITDVSVLHGFLQLPKLVVLRIFAICKFSPDVRTALEGHVWDINIDQPEELFEDEESNVESKFSSENESESESEYSNEDSDSS